MKKLIFLVLLVFSCVSQSNIIAYQPQTMDYEDALNVVDELTWTQKNEYLPEEFVITDKYINWVSTESSKSVSLGTEVGNISIEGGGNQKTNKVQERFYFSSISKVSLEKDYIYNDYSGNPKLVYIVKIFDTYDRWKMIYTHNNILFAQKYIDAIETIIAQRRI